MNIKIFFAMLFSLVLSVSTLSVASAAPFNAENNPNIVANYPTGPHGIVGDSEYHEGADVVMKDGNSPTLQQWFYGTSASNGLHGDHSVWKVSKDGTCPDNWILFPQAYPSMGDYLEPGADYCVMTNEYHPSH